MRVHPRRGFGSEHDLALRRPGRAILGCFWIVLMFAACTSTGYHPLTRDGGYSSQPLSRTVYRVTFQGNPYTSTSAAKDYALLRCAELTIANGCRYFDIIKAAPSNSRYADVTVRIAPVNSGEMTDAVQIGNSIKARYHLVN